ncbi:luciferase [candidate division MSBL1 archaeon SCGC-AAA259M10]|uniref:Luciferase n=1 Tax=candidate division MSBL1 archaeon SCGC-AAA259M10 TaxID=1698270 RepID=A0A133V0M8_9EURY|nr:luciferase [candidate division MSBL1 archaeon SCGC-AAA259M10]
MKFGLFLNPQAPLGQEPESIFEGLVEQTREARDGGFDLIMTGQHYLTDYIQLQLFPLLSRLSAESGSMTVATGIVLLPLHHPIEIAEMATTLDVIAEDVVVGVGVGYRDIEFESFGVKKSERGDRLKEGVQLMKELWANEEVTFDGEYYSVNNVSINPRPEKNLPVWVAANSRSAIERAARISEGWLVNSHSTVSEILGLKQSYDDIREQEGETMEVPVIREAFVAPSREEAVEIGRKYLGPKYKRYIEWGQDEAMEDEEDLHRSFDDLTEDRFLLGTPEEVSDQIERCEKKLDANYMIFRIQWPGLPHEKALRCIQLIGDEIIPNF